MVVDELTCEIGGATREELLARLDAEEVQLNEHARTLLATGCFDPRPAERAELVVRTVGGLGLDAGGTFPQLHAAARRNGLVPCPPDAGPYLRLAILDQEQAPDSVLSAGRVPAGALNVISEPLSTDPEFPKGFYLRHVDGVRWLRGFRCDDEYVWPPGSQVVLRRP